MYLATVYPNRIAVRFRNPSTQKYTVTRFFDEQIKQWEKSQKINVNATSINNLNQKKKSVNLSPASKRKLRDSIMLMYQLSKPRKVQIKKDKFIYNYRASFITLTLPCDRDWETLFFF